MSENLSEYTLKDSQGRDVTITAELLGKIAEEHQPEARFPINTEIVQLYKTGQGRYLLYQSFCFEDTDPHFYGIFEGADPAQILEGIRFPTEATRRVCEAAA